MVFYREEHSSIFLNICWLHNVVSADEVVLNVIFLERAEETITSRASVLKFLLTGQGAQPGLGEGLAHGPRALLPVPGGLRHGPDPLGEGKPSPGLGGRSTLGGQVKFGLPAATDVVELLDALID